MASRFSGKSIWQAGIVCSGFDSLADVFVGGSDSQLEMDFKC
jgi:hypothetical protein